MLRRDAIGEQVVDLMRGIGLDNRHAHARFGPEFGGVHAMRRLEE